MLKPQKIAILGLLPRPNTCFQLTVKYLTKYKQVHQVPIFATAASQWHFGLADVGCVSTPVAVRSKAWVCGRLRDGITGSNPTWSADVSCEYCVLSGRGLCDGPIPRMEEFYRECVYVSFSVTKKERRRFASFAQYLLFLCLSFPPFHTPNIAVRFWT